MKTLAFGLLLGAAAVAASTNLPSTVLGQNPAPQCIPHTDCVKK